MPRSDREFRLKLLPSGTPEAFRRFSGGFKRGGSFLCRHGDCRLDFGQAASGGGGQYRRGGRLRIRKIADDQPIMPAKGQVPPDEFAAYALEQFGDGLLT